MIRLGDGVFYADNQAKSATYCPIAVRTIQSLGLVPYFYVGAGMDVRGSSLDREIHDDFYKSKVVVLIFGKGEGWRSIEDNWATPELKPALLCGIKCLIYSTEDITSEEVELLGLPVKPTKIKDENEFSTVFEHDLQRLMILAS